MSEIQIGLQQIFSQSKPTAERYLTDAFNLLIGYDHMNWTMADAISLAQIMSRDVHTMTISLKLQQIKDAIHENHSTE